MSALSPLPRLRLRKHEQQRLRAGHVWVYANEIDTAQTPLRSLDSALVQLEDHQGQLIGLASFNKNALICARLLDRSDRSALDRAFFDQRLGAALSLREQVFAQPCYRLVYGEGDFLPGLVVDRFGAVLTLQTSTQAMEDALPVIADSLRGLLGEGLTLVVKNDGKGRQIEGLPSYVRVEGPAVERLALSENGVAFEAPLDAQKTGWFYDHRLGRQWLNGQAEGRRVLDLFSYLGGWGIQAAAHGASAVTCVDVSARACEFVQHNARRNGLNQVEAIEADVFDWLKNTPVAPYDVVVLDPPALIQKRRDFDTGRQAYFRLNEQALQRVAAGGLLVSASCSLHLKREDLLLLVQQVARRLGRSVQLIHEAHPAADHPRLPAVPELDYLKCLFFRVW